MDLRELLEVLWRRKILVAGLTIIALVGALLGLNAVTPQYESTATVALNPQDIEKDLFVLTTINSIMPVYSSAATSPTMREEARARLGGQIGKIRVEVPEDTPLLRIKARDPDPEVARASAQAVAGLLLERANRGEIGIPSLRLTLLDFPRAASEPVFPRRNLTIMFALLLGLAAGVGAALLRESFTSTIETADELAQAAGAPVFAEIATERAVARLRGPTDMTSSTRLRAFAESLRDLRTNLLFSTGGKVRSIVVTSPEGSHGKTTISVGLATTLARAGTKTVLVDADLRKGRIAELMGIQREPGLIDALDGRDLRELLRGTTIETLDVLPGGAFRSDPGELLAAEFRNVLERLEELYETVVVDSTPLVPVNDARVAASSAEAVIVVVSAEEATRRQVRTAIERLGLLDITPTAAVLNNAKRPRGKGYYGYLGGPEPQPAPMRGSTPVLSRED